MYHLPFNNDDSMFGHFILPLWNAPPWGWEFSTAETYRCNSLV